MAKKLKKAKFIDAVNVQQPSFNYIDHRRMRRASMPGFRPNELWAVSITEKCNSTHKVKADKDAIPKRHCELVTTPTGELYIYPTPALVKIIWEASDKAHGSSSPYPIWDHNVKDFIKGIKKIDVSAYFPDARIGRNLTADEMTVYEDLILGFSLKMEAITPCIRHLERVPLIAHLLVKSLISKYELYEVLTEGRIPTSTFARMAQWVMFELGNIVTKNTVLTWGPSALSVKYNEWFEGEHNERVKELRKLLPATWKLDRRITKADGKSNTVTLFFSTTVNCEQVAMGGFVGNLERLIRECVKQADELLAPPSPTAGADFDGDSV